MGPPSGARRIPGPGASPCRWRSPHAGLEGPPLVWSPIHIYRDSMNSPASSRLWCFPLRPPPVRHPPRPPCRTAPSSRLERSPLCQDPAPACGSGQCRNPHSRFRAGPVCFSMLAGVCEVRSARALQCGFLHDLGAGIPQCRRGHVADAALEVSWPRGKSARGRTRTHDPRLRSPRSSPLSQAVRCL